MCAKKAGFYSWNHPCNHNHPQTPPHTLLSAPNAIHSLLIYSTLIYFRPTFLSCWMPVTFSVQYPYVFWSLHNDIWLFVWRPAGKVSGWWSLNLPWRGCTNAAADKQLKTDRYWLRREGGSHSAAPNSGRMVLVLPLTEAPDASVDGYLLPPHPSLWPPPSTWPSSLPLF